MKHLEVCVENLEGAIIAEQAGATRIELSERLDVGGVTPSSQLISQVVDAVSIPVIVLIRCRPGAFQYDASEKAQMLDSAKQMLKQDVAGFAVGALTDASELDWGFIMAMHELVANDEKCLVVHRAFDAVVNPLEAIERLIDIGYQRILTSGGPIAAYDGRERLKGWVDHAQGRIGILPAGGINSSNAKDLLRTTKCTELHGSFRDLSATALLPSPEEIQSVREILDQSE